ncbi:MAG: hypothetical protein ACI4MC_04400 [Candidatus Coproplasma sp.]
MDVTFETGIGAPASFAVEYDEEEMLLHGYADVSRLSSCCKVISADFKLKIFFDAEDGEFTGIEYYCSPAKLPAVSLTKPLTCDGFIKLKEQLYMTYGVNYVAYEKAEACFDKDAKLIVIGEQNDGLSFYRVCENTSFGVDSVGKLSCILIET